MSISFICLVYHDHHSRGFTISSLTITTRLANVFLILPFNIVVYGISFVIKRMLKIMYLYFFGYFQFYVSSVEFKALMAMATEETVI